jgi:hypothetical protein
MTAGQLITLAGSAAILAAFAIVILILKKVAPIPPDREVGSKGLLGGLITVLLGAMGGSA